MKVKKAHEVKDIKEEGFKLEELFKEVDRVTKKAKSGDKASKEILDSAYRKWEESGLYV